MTSLLVGPTWTFRLHLLRDDARECEHELHRFVSAIRSWLKHQRAAARDHIDSLLPAVGGRCGGYAPAAGPAGHPYVFDAEGRALAHRRLGPLRPGSDHHRVDAARDRLQFRVTLIALDVVGIGIHREHLITA